MHLRLINGAVINKAMYSKVQLWMIAVDISSLLMDTETCLVNCHLHMHAGSARLATVRSTRYDCVTPTYAVTINGCYGIF